MHRLLTICAALMMMLGLTAFKDHPFFTKVPYSADVVYTTPHGKMTGRVFHSGDMIERREMNAMGQRSVTIMDPKTGIIILMPDMKMAMRMPKSDNPMDNINEKIDDFKYEAIGSETINGEATTKYKVANPKEKLTGTFWVTKDGIIMKMEMHANNQKFVYDTQNVKRGPQAKSLFQIPPGFKVTEMGNMGPMMDNMGGDH